MEEQVIVVNEADEPIGVAGKMEAHRKGILHRAFSIFIFNSKGEMLLQQRALNKYHSGSLWTNACCSHPKPEEDTTVAAERRLKEEMGFDTPIEKVFDFVYRAEFENGLTEHEFDHVYAGEYNGEINFNKEEVMDCCFKSMDELKESLQDYPSKYTKWFQLAFPKMQHWWSQRYKNVVV